MQAGAGTACGGVHAGRCRRKGCVCWWVQVQQVCMQTGAGTARGGVHAGRCRCKGCVFASGCNYSRCACRRGLAQPVEERVQVKAPAHPDSKVAQAWRKRGAQGGACREDLQASTSERKASGWCRRAVACVQVCRGSARGRPVALHGRSAKGLGGNQGMKAAASLSPAASCYRLSDAGQA